MAQRRHHYEHALEQYLRAIRVPYVAVDEARKALLPDSAEFRVSAPSADGKRREAALKSFDFVLYGAPGSPGGNLLAEVKGRKIIRRARKSVRAGSGTGRLESWVTLEDVRSLQIWQQLFGPEFHAAFVFVYWCDEQPPDGLFQEIFEHRGRWYAVRAVHLEDYTRVMKVRSPRWGTVHVAPVEFERISSPLAGPRGASAPNLWGGLELGPSEPAIDRL